MFTLNELITWRAGLHPDLVGLVDERGQRLDYGQLAAEVDRCADRWRRRGVASGQVVAVLDTNSVVYFINLLGLSRLGAIPALLNWRLTAAENADLFELVQPVAVAVGPGLGHKLPDTAAPIVELETGQDRSSERHGSTERHPLPPLPQPSQPFALAFSSGTTGRPKAIPMRHEQLVRSAMVDSADVAGMAKGARQLMVGPTFHLAGLANTFMGLSQGAEIHLRESFDPDRVLDDIETLSIEYMTGVPAMFQAMTAALRQRSPAPRLGSVRELTYGASPIAAELVQELAQVFPGAGLRQFYGMTEVAGALTTLTPADHHPESPHRFSAGRVNPGFTVKLVDGDGRTVKDGQPGEVMVKGPPVMSGYWNAPEATAAAFRDGWFATGDIAVRNDGYLTVMDRAKDMVVSGGENIYPAEVESALYAHPDVADVAVIGIPDDRFGEQVHALVVTAAEAAPDPDDLQAFCRHRLAGYKIPRSFEFVERLPRNPTGKLLKRELRARYWTGSDRSV